MSEGSATAGDRRAATSMTSAFDQAIVTVRPGADVVARLPGMLLLTAVADTDEGDARLRAVLDLLQTIAAGGGFAPGRALMRELPKLLEDVAVPADLAVVAATEASLAVVLSGAGSVAVAESGLRLASVDGRVVTRELDWPPAPLILYLGADHAVDREPARRAAARPFDLRAGVVPGAAAVLTPPPPATTATGTVLLGDATVLLPPPTPEPEAAEPLPPPRYDQILGATPLGPVRSALPVPAAGAPFDLVSCAAVVRGYRCRDGHLNDPRVLFCATCGIRMAESTSTLVEGPRPPLGLLVFDNGASFALDEHYLLGREPDVDERVRAGQIRPLVLFDTTGAISRRHAEIRLEEWDVLLIDYGSANGTFVAERDARQWSVLVPGQAIRMSPSMQVRIGERSFVFESLHDAP